MSNLIGRTAESRYVQNGDVRLHFLDSQASFEPTDTRPPLVFVCGMTDMADDYHEIIPTLGRRAIVMDLRGHGKSDSPPLGNWSMEHQMSDVATVIDQVTHGPIHLMTFSRGTCYALGWAYENAGRVRSISIGDYPARVLKPPAEIIDGFIESRWRGSPTSTRVTADCIRGTFGEAEVMHTWDRLAGLGVPVLVVRAGTPSPMNDEDWELYETKIGATRVLFEESPHDIFRPDRHRYPTLVRDHITAAD